VDGKIQCCRWLEHVAKPDDISVLLLQAAVRRCIMRLSHGRMAESFRAWRQAAAERAALGRRLARFALRAADVRMQRALQAWRAAAAAGKAKAELQKCADWCVVLCVNWCRFCPRFGRGGASSP
jgi:hypothetical protein